MSLINIDIIDILPTACIDGKEYNFRIDLSYKDMIKAERIGKKIQTLESKIRNNEQEDEDENEIQELLRKSVAMMLDAPPDILEKLTDFQRTQIMKIFNREVKKYMDPPAIPTGEILPGLEDSTAEA